MLTVALIERNWYIWEDLGLQKEHNQSVWSSLRSMENGVSHTNVSGILGGRVAYEWWSNKTIVFNRPIAEMPATIGVQLVVVDPDTLGETDMLPIPPEMEIEIIAGVLELLGARGKPDLTMNANDQH